MRKGGVLEYAARPRDGSKQEWGSVMMKKTLARSLAAAALLIGSAGAQANVISLEPIGQEVGLHHTFSLEISSFFAEATVGGSFDLFYDPTLFEFVSFEFDENFLNNVSDPAFAHVPDNCFTDGAPFGGCSVGDAELNAIGFGSFDGISGTNVVATVLFRSIGNPGTGSFLMAVNDAPFEGFFSAETGLEMTVSYNSAKVVVTPVPAAAWLLLSALGLLGIRRRR
jgi:hypothetical protein